MPFLLLLALPLSALAYQVGALRSPIVRYALGALVLGILWFKSPPQGYDRSTLDHAKLVLAVSVTMLLVMRQRLSLRTTRIAVIVAACVGALLHYNVGAFHGYGGFAHFHDVAHYYLGGKYSVEVGYGELYTAVARAELESHGGKFPVEHARDLRSGGVAPIAVIAEAGKVPAARFTAERWTDFLKDVEALHGLMGPQFAVFLNDHGYNPTPVWSLVGGRIANLVSAGDREGIRVLTLLDPLLLAIAFAAVGWGFGLEAACLAIAYYGVLYGAIFDWVGGAFFRNGWFAATLIATALWHRKRELAAGPLLALAASFRIFPAFFLLAPAASLLISAARRQLPSRSDIRLLGSAAAFGTVLLIATLIVLGPSAWLGFARNMHAHTEILSSNFIGLPTWLRYAVFGIGLGGGAEAEELFAPTGPTYRMLSAILLLSSSLLAMRLSFRTEDAATKIALGLFPIAFALRLAHYYSIFLVVLVLAHRARPDRLAMLFGAEAILYVLALFEIHFSVMCLFRGLVVCYLLIALWMDEIRDELRELLARRSLTPVTES